MSATEFSIQYPVFVLKTGVRQTICMEIVEDERGAGGWGLVVFTTECGADEFRRSSPSANGAQIRRFDQEEPFRELVRNADPKIVWIIIDPRNDGEMIRMRWTIPRAGFVERYLSEAAWGWDYPVYALHGWNGYAHFDGYYTPDGETVERPLKMVIVLTDEDLATREAATRLSSGCMPISIDSPRAFAKFLRELPANVEGVVFDPPTKPGDWRVRTFKFRAALIAELEAEF